MEKVSDVLYDDGRRKSIRNVSATTGLLYSGVRGILVKEINLYPHKARVPQKLNARHIENRLAFCQRVKNMKGSFELNLSQIIFSDGSHIYIAMVSQPTKRSHLVKLQTRI